MLGLHVIERITIETPHGRTLQDTHLNEQLAALRVRIAVRIEQPQRHGKHQADGHHEAKGHAHALIIRPRLRHLGIAELAVRVASTSCGGGGGCNLGLCLARGLGSPRADHRGLCYRWAAGRRRGGICGITSSIRAILFLGSIIALLPKRRTVRCVAEGSSFAAWIWNGFKLEIG